MKKFLTAYKPYVATALVLAAYVLLLHIFGIHCPIRYLTGISCPGCGMTRACLSLVRLDVTAALVYHPLVFLVPPAAVALFVLHRRGKRRALRILLYVLIAAFVAVYLWRMLWERGDIVVFAPERSLPARIIARFGALGG